MTTTRLRAVFVALLIVAAATPIDLRLQAQSPAPAWTGIAADEARPSTGASLPEPFTAVLGNRALSGDGRFVVFVSRSPLVQEDTNGDWDVYLRDRQAETLERVSAAPGGGDADGASSFPVLSGDGRFVVYSSSASNLVTGDTNGVADLFAYDRVAQTTTRLSAGPNGEEPMADVGQPSVSSDGRYVAFLASFPLPPPAGTAWLLDRDPDNNGTFDELGTSAVTELPLPAASGTDRLFAGGPVLSGDARFVGFVSQVYTGAFEFLGARLDVLDRTSNVFTTVTPGSTDPQVPFDVDPPDFAGTLVTFATSAPGLVPGDAGNDVDVFTLDLETGVYERLAVTHPAAPVLAASRAPAISGTGRYVAFTGIEILPNGGQLANVFAVDRTTGLSYDVSVRPDGARTDTVSGAVSVSDDGSAIAFQSNPAVLVDGSGFEGVFVAIDLTLSPASIDISPDGGAASIDVSAPSTTGWAATVRDLNQPFGLLQMSAVSGIGPGVIDVSLPPNHSGDARQYRVVIGSEHVVVNQVSSPVVYYLSPTDGPAAGGTEVAISGEGFTAETTVSFGSQPAASVVVESSAFLRAVTPPGVPGGVDVVVSTGPGLTSTLVSGFTYIGETIIDVPWVSGPYGGSVTLTSSLFHLGVPLAGRTVDFFVDGASIGVASTNGVGQASLPVALGRRAAGSHDVRVEFAGESGVPPATGHGLITVQPTPLTIRVNDSTKVFGAPLPTFTVKGTGFVNGESLTNLNGVPTFSTAATSTSAPGAYPVTVGGLWSLNYDITFVHGTLTIQRAATTTALVSTPDPSRHRDPVTIRAAIGVVAPGAGVPSGTVTFRKDGVLIGTAPVVNGVATLTTSFRRGVYLLTAVFIGDGNFTGSGALDLHVTW